MLIPKKPKSLESSFPKLSLKVPKKFPKQSHVELRFSLLRRGKKRGKRSSLRSVSACATDSGGPAEDGRVSEAKRMSLASAPAPGKDHPRSFDFQKLGIVRGVTCVQAAAQEQAEPSLTLLTLPGRDQGATTCWRLSGA